MTRGAAVAGQSDAMATLAQAATNPVHAYLFVGPAGTGKLQAARAFAEQLLASNDTDGRTARLVRAGEHPDVIEVERVGAAISKPQAAEIVRRAALAPVEGAVKVMILDEFHLLSADAAAVLLKTIEEPPPGNVFIVLADQVTPDLVTIASRCVRITFRPLTDAQIASILVSEGVAADHATAVAAAAGGNLDRARLLSADEGLNARRQAFAAVPRRLDGSGSAVVTTVRDLLDVIDAAADALKARHSAEVVELDARAAEHGERGSGRKSLEERHKRELRRHRLDELRSGLAVLAGVYRDAMSNAAPSEAAAYADAVNDIHRSLEALERNPNEPLLMQALLYRLAPLR
jgi:DNA polymerase III subunit delta'